MPLIDDNESNGASLIWSIQNFSYCTQRFKEYFASPSFDLDTNSSESWKLVMFPRGDKNSDYVVPGLRRQAPLFSPPVKVSYVLSIRNKRGQFKKLKNKTCEFEPNLSIVYFYFATRHEVFKNEASGYLDNDTLVLRCRVLQVGDKVLESVQYYARTIISVEKATSMVDLNMFKEKPLYKLISPERSSFDLKFKFLKGGGFVSDSIKMDLIPRKPELPKLSICDLSLLNESGQVIYSIRDEFRPEDGQFWSIPSFSFIDTHNYEKLVLRCDFAFCYGDEYSILERIENGEPCDHQVECPNQSDFSNVLPDDLRRLYTDGKFTDFIIRTPTKDFPIHKNILWARSEVFVAMFERDMKEGRLGFVNIIDIDDNIIQKMLLFAYTDIVEGLDYDAASKLYFAADKYAITALKRNCSEFLKSNISKTNACDALVLANLHRDEDLECFVQNFILDNAAEILGSETWEMFIKDHMQLASTVMHKLCKRNF